MKLTDINTIFGETLAKLDATLATVDVTLPALLGEEIDAYIADLAALKLEAIDDLDVLLAKTATPVRPTASTPPPPPPPPPATGTVKISVRITGRVLAAIKARAAERRQPYQKVLNQALHDAAKGWEAQACKTGLV